MILGLARGPLGVVSTRDMQEYLVCFAAEKKP